jgi:hypothetical protein
MSFDRRDGQGWSQSPTRATAAAGGPGKRTQVDMLSARGLAGGHGAIGAADAAAAPHHAGDAADTAHHAEHDHHPEGEDAALGPGSNEPGEVVCQASGEAEAGATEDADSSESPLVEEAHELPGAAGADHEVRPAAAAPPPPGGQPVPGAGPPAPTTTTQLDIQSATVKHAARGASSRTTVGVGEHVHLTGSTAGNWSANHGALSNPSGAHSTWTAPATPGTTTIRLSAGGKTVSKAFRVIAPTGLTMKKASEDTFPAGQQGVGMITNVTIHPTNVSFGNVQWLEVPGPASNITGYFTRFPGLPHHPNPSWLPWNDKNTGLTDHASLFRWPRPWSVGGFQWAIPNKWRVTSAGGAGHVFTTTHQVFRMLNSRGTTTITKGGASVTRTP